MGEVQIQRHQSKAKTGFCVSGGGIVYGFGVILPVARHETYRYFCYIAIYATLTAVHVESLRIF